MGNIRHLQHLKIQKGDFLIDQIGDFQTVERVGYLPVAHDPAAQERADERQAQDHIASSDYHRFADPMDPIMAESLRVVHKSDLTGAEKLASIQALQRMVENNCGECGGGGWILETTYSSADPQGVQDQVICPQCQGIPNA